PAATSSRRPASSASPAAASAPKSAPSASASPAPSGPTTSRPRGERAVRAGSGRDGTPLRSGDEAQTDPQERRHAVLFPRLFGVHPRGPAVLGRCVLLTDHRWHLPTRPPVDLDLTALLDPAEPGATDLDHVPDPQVVD